MTVLFGSGSEWIDSSLVARLSGLSVWRVRDVLKSAYHAGLPWHYRGVSYSLSVRRVPHPVVSNRFVYRVLRSTLPPFGAGGVQLSLVDVKRSAVVNLEEPVLLGFEPFCDWVTVSQEYPISLQPVNNGCVVALRIDGTEEYLVDRHFPLVGSFDSSLYVRVISREGASRVDVSGNPSRWGRPDNVFGLSLPDVVKRLNEIFEQVTFRGGVKIPPFTVGESYQHTEYVKKSDGTVFPRTSLAWTGARLSRVDLALNYSLGRRSLDSPIDDRVDFLNLLTFVGLPYLRTSYRTDCDGRVRTVYWGVGTHKANNESTRFVAKAYDKAHEIRSRIKDKNFENREYFENLLNYLDINQVVRFEVKYKRLYLRDNCFSYLGDVLGRYDEFLSEFRELCMKIVDRQVDVSRAELLRFHHPATYRWWGLWQQGDDLRSLMRPRTFRHHQLIIRNIVGVDIGRPRLGQVVPLIRTVRPRPVLMPGWYSTEMRVVGGE